MPVDELVSCPGVLALEVTPGTVPARSAMERDEAEHLAACLAEDLRGLLPRIEQARLAVVGAHFDSTEVLRPGFPVFAALTSLARGADGGIVAFGTRDGHMPAAPLVPDPALRGGALRVVPWTLLADRELATDLVATMESDLGGKGEVGKPTADRIMRSFDTSLAHARYFTPHDLMALVQVHYEHANLTPLWALIEPALLTPERTEATMSAHGLAWRYAGGQAIAQTPGAWLATTHVPGAQRAHELGGIVFELRQYAALLGAHRIPLAFDAGHHDVDGQFVVDTLAATDPQLPPPRLYAHTAPGLGTIALSVAQMRANDAHRLALAWPLAPDLGAACRYLADTYACPQEPERLGDVVLDTNGQLRLPAAATH